MPVLIDFDTARQFADELNLQLRRCDNGEGQICGTLDETINHYAEVCGELRTFINQWAKAVFTGDIEFDPVVETILKNEVKQVLQRSKQLAARGRALDGYCYLLQGLNALNSHIVEFDYLLENWVSPQRAVSPAPRIRLSRASERGIHDAIASLPQDSDLAQTHDR